ncbi:probable G-protein coupled receptor B0563.6 [Physella acuta]|uniref:probable G-protein coupled receptor B0563.6 n=1 Tax=Physella acuta TaxID=109671 RepID=UPI0027DCA712|nr:probable G-protein coupled receptor B0563.6 [Physella acuta]
MNKNLKDLTELISNDSLVSDFEPRGSHDGIYDVSDDAVEILRVLTYNVIMPVLCVMGISGNCLTIVVLKHHGFKDTTNLLLASLAVSDLLYSLLGVVFCVEHFIYPFSIDLYSIISIYISLYLQLWNNAFLSTSVYCVVIIAMERMVAVVFPFKAALIITPTRITVSLVFVFLVCPPLYCLEYLTHDLLILPDTVTNYTYYIPAFSQFYLDNEKFVYMYNNVFLNIVFIGFPILLIMTSAILIVAKLKTSMRKVAGMSSAAHKKRVMDVRAIKITLSLCVCMMVLVLIPTNVTSWYIVYTDYQPFSISSQMVFTFVARVTGPQLNASINFFIYVQTSSKFANTYRKIFLTCTKKTRG